MSETFSYLLNTKLLVPSVGFSVAGLDRAKFSLRSRRILILLKLTFSRILIHSQSLVKTV